MTTLNHVRDIYATTNVIKFSDSITDVITISERLKFAREDAQLTQEQLAKKGRGCTRHYCQYRKRNPKKTLAN